jgi:hypothetical protein
VGQYYLAQDHATKAPHRMIPTEIQALRDITHAAWVDRITLWDTVEEPISDDGILKKAAGWHLEEERPYQSGSHWDWQLKFTLRKRTFSRKTATTHEAKPSKETREQEAEEVKRRLRELEDLTRQVERERHREQRR